MNEDSVIIDDDDVVMVESVEIPDDDTRTTAKQAIIEIVDLDEEPLPTPRATNGDSVKSSTTNNHDTVVDIDNDRESSFARLLKNNTILNKIVQRCLNMTNNGGMSRVIHKTLMPLYKDADNKFKESEVFSTVLNTILRNLKTDPDHKFLHIKSLCEELKAGKYRRKVPFVTLTTDLKKNRTSVPSDNEEKEESDTDISAPPIIRNKGTDKYIQERKEEKNNDTEVTAVIIRKKQTQKNLKAKFKKYRNTRKVFNKRRKKRKTANKKTDVINIDNSDDESVITLDGDDESDDANDIMILGETDDNITKETSLIRTEKDTTNVSDPDILSSQNSDDSSNHSNKENSQIETENEPTRSTNDNNSASQNLDKNTSHYDKENNQIEAEDDDKSISSNDDKSISSNDDSRLQTVDDNSNHSNKESSQNESQNEITKPPDDLLVPQNSVDFEEHNAELAKARRIVEQIDYCQKMIVWLEEMEVTNNYQSSPYLQCDKFKAKIVGLYKKLCKLTGSGDGNLMKQRVVRLHVAKGHPAGPVRCLERFLNNSIDETGAVPLPDFHDVLQCVTDSNVKDKLGWNKQQIMREALGLFTHCGNALRKNRQRREYKDLLSLVRDKTQDDHDPANEDPLLLAKLEENKLIAKAKENEILERYSRMEFTSNNAETFGLESVKVTRKRPGDSDSDSTTDEESIPRKRLKTNTILEHKNKEQQNLDANKCPNETLTEGNNNQVINGTCNTNNTRPPNDKEIINNPIVPALDDPLQKILSCCVAKYAIPQPKDFNTKAPLQNTLIIRTSSSFFTSIQNIINITTENALNKIENPTNAIQNLENINTQNALNKTIQNVLNTSQNSINATHNTNNTTHNTNNTTQNTNNTTHNTNNTTQNTINTTHNPMNTVQNPYSITQETINATTQNAITPILHLNPIKERTATNQIAWPDTLKKVGVSNRYVVAFNGKSTENTEPDKINDSNTIGKSSNTSEIENVTVVPSDSNMPQNSETEKTNDSNSIETNVNTSENQENVTIKEEKEEPVDIQTLLNALGDNYISTVFDIEDPFLVIDISSDSSDDDDL